MRLVEMWDCDMEWMVEVCIFWGVSFSGSEVAGVVAKWSCYTELM